LRDAAIMCGGRRVGILLFPAAAGVGASRVDYDRFTIIAAISV